MKKNMLLLLIILIAGQTVRAGVYNILDYGAVRKQK